MRPWSYSRLSCWEQCPKKYWYQYVEKLPVAPRESPAADRGSDIHDKAERYLKGELSMYPPELQKVSAHAMLLKQKEAKAEVHYGTKVDWSPCDYDAKDAYFRGIIDIEYIEHWESGPVVCLEDWKTGQIYATHADQLKQYVALAASHHPEAHSFRSRPVYIDQGVIAAPVVTMPDRVKPIRMILDGKIKNAEEDTIFPVRSGQHCKWCDYSQRYGGPCPN